MLQVARAGERGRQRKWWGRSTACSPTPSCCRIPTLSPLCPVLCCHTRTRTRGASSHQCCGPVCAIRGRQQEDCHHHQSRSYGALVAPAGRELPCLATSPSCSRPDGLTTERRQWRREPGSRHALLSHSHRWQLTPSATSNGKIAAGNRSASAMCCTRLCQRF